ncbi:MAG TPA: diguanylate cyclase [Planctomycetota bacterium]|nr:diguanylate cyclase [Planctomycetota bacterium]
MSVAMISDYVREPGAILVPDTGQRLRLLTDHVRNWGRCTRVDEFLQKITRAAVELTGARRAVVILTSLVDTFQVASYAPPVPGKSGNAPEEQQFNRELVEQVVLSGKAVYARDIRESQPLDHAGAANHHEPHTVTGLPLDSGNRHIGVLYVEHPNPPAGFDETDLQLLEMLALQGAIALENFNNLTRATTDPLTRVYTHRHFMMLVDHELRQSRREGISNALVLLDLDHFKRINDSLGHAAGNDYIVEYAEFLKSHARSSDVIGRFGGDEFEILLPNTNRAGAEIFAQKMLSALKHVHWKHGRAVTNSIGISVYTDHAEQAEMLFQKADEALYEAKAQGRNCYVVAFNKAETLRPVDWSLEGNASRAPMGLPQTRRSQRRGASARLAKAEPVLPFPRVAVIQIFEDEKPHTPAEIATQTGLEPRELAKILKQLVEGGKLIRQGRGKSLEYLRKI